MSTRNKNYLDPDFFKDEKGQSLFENRSKEPITHVCITDKVEGTRLLNEDYRSSEIGSLTEIVVGLGKEIPLWKQNRTLKWQFDSAFNNYSNSNELKQYIRRLFTDALTQWGESSPISFQEITDGIWDFEITLRPSNCNASGCTLASAFFPSNIQDMLCIYPELFSQSYNEQVETMIHEIGHIFGLRHFFAKEKEVEWRSEVFGTHHPLTIMNYGHLSKLTSQDRADIKLLYDKVWSNELKNINGVPIKLYNPRSY